jgi:O-antigen chain-terminating methyltransferase
LQAEIAAREQADKSLSQSIVVGQHGQREVDSLKTTLRIQAHRMDSLVQQLRALNSEGKPGAFSRPEANEGMQGQLYTDFEGVFRGSREDIKKRVSVYISRLKTLGIGTTTMPVIDVGCGRGEWLEVLAENGLTAVGVDSNHTMIEECTARKLPAHTADALEFLSTLPSESQGAVTGFHIVEHLSTQGLIQLLNESVRVLKPGGIAIFETPNPENLLVSSVTFHLDPTHRAPLPPALLQFLVESTGLCSPEILYLHPYPEAYQIRMEDGNPIAAFLNHHFYGPQDYAVIAKRL